MMRSTKLRVELFTFKLRTTSLVLSDQSPISSRGSAIVIVIDSEKAAGRTNQAPPATMPTSPTYPTYPGYPTCHV